tara:strand:+ start:430 stop:558 length:129 start_codon:yes stop_codon:yes gene_type:complete
MICNMTYTENYINYLAMRIDSMGRRIENLEAIIEVEILNKEQ